MKKVLFISYLYPPIANSGTQRSIKFVNYLPDFGWKPIVLTVENPPDTSIEHRLMEEVDSNTHIERVPFWSDVLSKKIATILSPIIESKKMEEGIAWRIRIPIPDICGMWAPSAIKKSVELYQEEKYDMIYATGYPWTSFLIASQVGRKTGVPYILDYRDLWTQYDYSFGYRSRILKKFDIILEKRILSNASSILTVSQSLKSYIQNNLPNNSNCKIHVITNGYDLKDFNITVPFKKMANKKLNIVYTGVWKINYSPEELYCAVSEIANDNRSILDRIFITTAGYPQGFAAKYGISSIIKELGPVEHCIALNLMKEADVLFLPVPEGIYSKASLPGKLFEYIGSGTSILAYVPLDSEVANVLSDVGGSLCIEKGNINKLKDTLINLVLHGTKSYFSIRKNDCVAKYERKNQAKMLASILNDNIMSKSDNAKIS